MAALPEGAQRILDARLKGYRPADMVIVSMVGKVETQNPLVFARSATGYDWRWARGLDICLYVDLEDDWPPTLKDIALQRPEHLSLWVPGAGWGAKVYLIPTAEDVAKPVRQWRYELDFLPWMDFQNKDYIECKSYETT